jgi:hypothetical protein
MSNYYLNRWFVHRFFYGIKNILTLNGYDIFENCDTLNNAFNNAFYCGDWEKLFAKYT